MFAAKHMTVFVRPTLFIFGVASGCALLRQKNETTAHKMSMSAASALKAKLSAKKPNQYPATFSTPYPIHLFHNAAAASPVKQFTFKQIPLSTNENQDPGQLVESTFALARSLIATDKPQARRVLSNLVKQKSAVISTAAFWEVCLEIERGDTQRTAACFLLAIQNCTSATERNILVDSLMVDYFTQVVAAPVVESEVKSIGTILEKLSLLEVTPVKQQQQKKSVDVEPSIDVNIEWWQQQGEDAPLPMDFSPEQAPPPNSYTTYKSFFASPAARISVGGNQNSTPLRLSSKLSTPQKSILPTTPCGSIIVLSPVRESRKSDAKVATPVRRSTRTNQINSVEATNRKALLECDFAYTPNASLQCSLLQDEVSPEPQPLRRSSRKPKQVIRFAPKQ